MDFGIWVRKVVIMSENQVFKERGEYYLLT
jgi:hypothetical protein